jgi:hypothetical protein
MLMRPGLLAQTTALPLLRPSFSKNFELTINAPHMCSIAAIDASQITIDRNRARSDELGVSAVAMMGDSLCKPLAFADEKYRSSSLVMVDAAMRHFPDAGLAVAWLVGPGGGLYAEDVFDAGNKCHGADT